MLQPGDEFRLPKTVKISGGDSVSGHSWAEVYWSEEDGDYVEPDSPRSGVATLFERNGGTASAGTVVEARFRATVDGEPTYEFDAPPVLAVVYCTSSTPLAALYPVRLTDETSPGVWSAGPPARAKGLNGEALTNAVRYAARLAPYRSGGLPVYHALAACCGTPPDPPPDPCPCPPETYLTTKFCVTLGSDARSDFRGDYELSYDACGWFGQLGTDGTKHCSFGTDGAGVASLSFDGYGSGVTAYYSTAVSGTVASCSSGGTLGFSYGYLAGTGYFTDPTGLFPATVTVVAGACSPSSGPSSSPPPICDDAGDLCVTIPTFNADFSSRSWTLTPSSSGVWMGGDVDYDVTVDMTATSGGSRYVAVYILETGTGFGFIYAANYTSMDCAGGFTVANNSNSATPPSGVIAPTVTVKEGACP